MSNVLTWLVLIAMAIIGYMAVKGNAVSYANLPEFAQCLASKNIVMYGAEWCTDCRDEKRAFGDAWQRVRYVECPNSAELCSQRKIVVYPTWLFPNGDQLQGKQGLERLSKASGCELIRGS